MRLEPKHRLALGLVLVGILVGGAFFALLGYVTVGGKSAPGTVVDVARSSQGSCSPIVEYEVGGKTVRGSGRVKTSNCTIERGEKVTVYYYPASPDEPWLLSFSELFTPILLTAMFFVAAVVVALRKPKAEAGRPSPDTSV